MPVNKIKWTELGLVTEPGRYEYPFGYLTVSSEDLAVSKQFPRASFTLIRGTENNTEFRLGAFTLPEDFSLKVQCYSACSEINLSTASTHGAEVLLDFVPPVVRRFLR